MSAAQPFATLALTAIGTAQFTPCLPTDDLGGQIGVQVRVHGRWTGIVAGGDVQIRCVMVPDGVQPAPGDPATLALAGKKTWNGTDAENPSVVTTTPTSGSFSLTFYITSRSANDGDLIAFPARFISLRISNPTTAYTGGTLFIDDVEILG